MQRFAVPIVTLLFLTAGVPNEPAHAGSKDKEKIEFTVAGMNCEDCARKATKALESVSGVDKVKIDFATGGGSATIEAGVSREALKKALLAINMEILFPGERLVPPLTKEERAGLDINTVSHGERVDLAAALAPGKVTIFDYYADWCAPCRLLTPKLERLVLANPDLALRKVDIVNWQTDAARQATKEHGLKALPFVVVYGKDGKRLGEVVGLRMDEIEALVIKGTSS